jgi:Recombinase
MFSQDPLSGVYSGMMPCSNNHTTKCAVRCPARLSMTNNKRSGGSWSGIVGLTVRPACQRSHAVRFPSSGNAFAGESASRMASNSASKPGVQDHVRATGDAFDAHLAGGWMEQRQHLGRAMANVLMRVASRPTDGLPVHAWLGDRLVQAGFVHTPHRQSHPFSLGVGLLDQPFFALASGSWTLTSPRLRLRMTSPVWHQVRSCCHVIPPSCSTAQMVYVLTLGKPSGARRRARCKVFNDQVAVPSRSRSGGRRNSTRIRDRCLCGTHQQRDGQGGARSRPPGPGAVRTFFETFRRSGSATSTVRSFGEQGLLFPHPVSSGPYQGELAWGPLLHWRALRTLKNPRYAGAFVYGRSQARRRPDGTEVRTLLPREHWHTLIRDAHPGYITWDQFEDNLRRLHDNGQAYGADRRHGPPREGPALLQGLAVCGRCGGRMTIRPTRVHLPA